MKNAIIFGLLIGVLSAIWIFVTKGHGLSPDMADMKPIMYLSVFIPLIGLYFGIRSYRSNECKGNMGFLEALIQSFKILLVGGVFTVSAAIIYVDEIEKKNNIKDFSGTIFGALLAGLLFALGVSVLLTSKPNKVD